MLVFVRVAVEPGLKTAAVAREAPANCSLTLYFLLSDEKSMAVGVGRADIAAIERKYLVLQQQISDAAAAASAAAAAAAAVGAAAADGGSGPPAGTAAVGAGRWCGKIVRVVGTCGSWASPRNPQRQTRNKFVLTVPVQRINTSAYMPSPFSVGQHIGRPVARPVKSTGRPTEMAGPPVPSQCIVGLAANVMGRAVKFENAMGWAGPRPMT